MILNTTPTAAEWNRSVNEMNIKTLNEFTGIEKTVDRVNEQIDAIKVANADLLRTKRILINKIAWLNTLVANFTQEPT